MQLDLLMPAPLAMVNANLDLFPSTFLAYLPDNLHVYEAFEREALGVIAAGYSHYSARTIAEVLRHTSALRERNPDQYSGWKLNGNHVPYLSRLFGLMHPRHANLFELREAKVLRRDLGGGGVIDFDMARVAPEKAVFRPALPTSFLPGVDGAHMSKMTYGEQLRHPNWQRMRLEVLSRAKFSCQVCGDGEHTLHVHHKRYVKGRLAWEYEGHELIALCEGCHSSAHEEMEQLLDVVACLPLDGPSRLLDAVNLLLGWATAGQQVAPNIFGAWDAVNQHSACMRMRAIGRLAHIMISHPAWSEVGIHTINDACLDPQFVADVVAAAERSCARLEKEIERD